LIKEDTAKLITELQHVYIHQHWLRQERQESAMKRVIFRWKATKEMLADGLTSPAEAEVSKLRRHDWNGVGVVGGCMPELMP